MGEGLPQPSLLMLRHPFAGHALGFGELVGVSALPLYTDRRDETG